MKSNTRAYCFGLWLMGAMFGAMMTRWDVSGFVFHGPLFALAGVVLLAAVGFGWLVLDTVKHLDSTIESIRKQGD